MPQSRDDSDAELVSQTARAFLDRYGAKATAELEHFAELAAGIGDRFSADAWLEIADAVADLLIQQGAGRGSLFLHPVRTATERLPMAPVAVERWHALKARTLALRMPADLAEQLTRIADDLEHHAASLAARTAAAGQRI